MYDDGAGWSNNYAGDYPLPPPPGTDPADVPQGMQPPPLLIHGGGMQQPLPPPVTGGATQTTLPPPVHINMDGEGVTTQLLQQAVGSYEVSPLAMPPRMPMAQPRARGAMGAEGAPVAPNGAPANGSNMLGLSLLLVGVGAAVGAAMGGVAGAGAGILGAGALVNAVRAAKNVTKGSPDTDREAAVSGTYAVLGAGAALWVLYKSKDMKKNPSGDDDKDDDDDEGNDDG